MFFICYYYYFYLCCFFSSSSSQLILLSLRQKCTYATVKMLFAVYLFQSYLIRKIPHDFCTLNQSHIRTFNSVNFKIWNLNSVEERLDRPIVSLRRHLVVLVLVVEVVDSMVVVVVEVNQRTLIWLQNGEWRRINVNFFFALILIEEKYVKMNNCDYLHAIMATKTSPITPIMIIIFKF